MKTIKDALVAYAKMMNTLDSSEFELLLDDNFSYESQTVFTSINEKKEFIAYIRGKLDSIKKANATVYAELAEMNAYGQSECVVLAQNDKNNLVASVYVNIQDGKIVRIDMCIVPDPRTAHRTGIYPK